MREADPFHWLRERDNPEVLKYLRGENDHTRAVMAHTTLLQETLFDEIKGRIKQTDATVPYRLDDYFYYTRFEEGKEYPIYCRKRSSLEAPEETLLEVNELARGHAYYSVGAGRVSAGQDLLAFAFDTFGRRIYNIRFKNLTTGELLPDEIPDVTSNLAWANDNQTLLYARQDPVTLRWHRIYRHVLGADPARDELVYEELDETFSTMVFKSKSKAFLFIGSFQTVSSEFRFLDANDPTGQFRILQPRERDHEYELEHFGQYFYVRTNLEAKNFRLMRVRVERTSREHWEEVIPHRPGVFLEGFELFRDHLVVTERARGLTRMQVRPWSGEAHYLAFDEPAYLAHPTDNYQLDTRLLRFTYTSLTTPNSVYDYDMATRERVLLKRDEVLGGFDPANYRGERLYARAPDGTEVPVSLVYRVDQRQEGGNPLLLYGYGAYGISIDPTFNAPLISLLDRGFAYAIAHVRGGQDLGREWYEDGKLLEKKNSFTDFIACAEQLTQKGYARADRIYAMGGSAGGLLMGAVVNVRPDLFHGVVAHVPFVDVINTMLDETIPLTTGEYDEWGDPRDPRHYQYILSYSPYDNVERKAYPHMLVTGGLHDSQVQYWEPAKWVAKLRAMRTDRNRLLLKTNLEAGHHGASGRYRRYREVALDYAFVLDLAASGQPAPT